MTILGFSQKTKGSSSGWIAAKSRVVFCCVCAADAVGTLSGSISVDINVKKLQEETFEVELVINATAEHNKKAMFIIELNYAGIFTIKNPVNEQQLQEILFVYCPSLLFPFARRIIADTTKDASMPPLMLDTINFGALYESRKDSIKKTK